jgi:hypothetical protein
LLTLILAASTVLAQKNETPKAVVVDDFGKTSAKEIRKKTQKLRDEIAKRARKDPAFDVRVIFYYGKVQSSPNLESLVLNSLYENCYEYMRSTSPRIVIIRAGQTDEDRVKFWIIPKDAPIPSL